MKCNLHKSGARGFKVSVPLSMLTMMRVKIGDTLDVALDETLQYAPRLTYSHKTYKLTKGRRKGTAYLTIPPRWVIQAKINREDRFVDVSVSGTHLFIGRTS